jgi:leucyl-tRNA synthetase
VGGAATSYRLRDWLISRQRYWGTPIPIIHCPDCGLVPVPDDQLPVLLPTGVQFQPTGVSPLRLDPHWRFTTCPSCGGPAERDTDTMDTFVDSSWYQYRYLSPHFGQGPFDPATGDEWLPVDQYTGGAEHAVMHLLYTRFWTRVMRDLGLVAFDEPMLRLRNQGIILGADTEKMSKSRGNVVDPDDLVVRYGADTVRLFLMFIGPWDAGGPWNSRGIEGLRRFLGRAWDVLTGDVAAAPDANPELRGVLADTVARVTRGLDDFGFNTSIAALMELMNAMQRVRAGGAAGGADWTEACRTFTLLLAPFAPHVAEELWEVLGEPFSVHQQAWPIAGVSAPRPDRLRTLVVQVDGRVRERLEVRADLTESATVELALQSERVARALGGRPIARTVFVPDRGLLNIVAQADS